MTFSQQLRILKKCTFHWHSTPSYFHQRGHSCLLVPRRKKSFVAVVINRIKSIEQRQKQPDGKAVWRFSQFMKNCSTTSAGYSALSMASLVMHVRKRRMRLLFFDIGRGCRIIQTERQGRFTELKRGWGVIWYITGYCMNQWRQEYSKKTGVGVEHAIQCC